MVDAAGFLDAYMRAGFTADLLPIIPPGGSLHPDTTVPEGSKAKTPGYHETESGMWKGRANWNDRDATAAEIERWKNWPGVGIGVRTKRIAGIDIDITHEPLADALEQLALDKLGPAPCRIGQAPKRLLTYRVGLPGKIRIAFKNEAGDVQALEMLADGQHFVAVGIHGKTGKPYRWHRGSPSTLGLDGLTAITCEAVQAFREAAIQLMQDHLGPVGYKLTANTEAGARGESRNDGNPVTTEVSDLDRKRARDLIAGVGGPVPEGQRHETILRLGLDIKDLIGSRTVYDTLMHEAWVTCAPDYPQNEFESTKDSTWRGGENRPGSKSTAVVGPERDFADLREAWAIDGREVPPETAGAVLSVFIGDRYVEPAAKRVTTESGGGAKGVLSSTEMPPLTPDEWAARDLPDPDYLLGSWLHTTSRALIVGATGLGKTNFLLALAAAMADGRPFLCWPARRACRLLYIDGEMSNRLLKQRVADACRRLGKRPATLFTLSHEDVRDPPNKDNPTGGLAPLNTLAGQAYVERLIRTIGGVDFIVFDNIMSLLGGEMKETEPWSKALPWILSLTKRGIGQAWAHHTGHDESRSYGDKTREWGLDTVIHLTAAKRDGVDVSFDLSFRKARERTPGNRAEFADMRVGLEADHWAWGAIERKAPGKVSPMGEACHGALLEALDASSGRLDGQRSVTLDDWRDICVTRGLFNADKPDSVRAMFSKYRGELVAANRIHVEGKLVRLPILGTTADEDWQSGDIFSEEEQ